MCSIVAFLMSYTNGSFTPEDYLLPELYERLLFGEKGFAKKYWLTSSTPYRLS